jgi:hypothetical protein
MSRVIAFVGVALFAFGAWQGLAVYSFVKDATPVMATVTSIQELRGPPKPRQKTSVHLLYTTPQGEEQSAVATLPFLQRIQQGDRIQVLVAGDRPGEAKLPLWSELWARTLTYLVGGALLIIVGSVLRTKRLR